jgi:isocitrate/isopropylmalate dehydrogenase
MLDWLKLSDHARKVERAGLKVYAEGQVRTGDLGGKANNQQFTDAIIAAL